MRFWKTPPGALVLMTAFTVGVGAGALGIRVHQVTRPARHNGGALNLAADLVKMEPVRFRSSDGIDLAGWLIPGKPDLPAIVLCHDLGGSKSSLVNLAIPLQRHGFTLLAFDFRGHGESGGERSTFGLVEKRDVIGAVDYLATVHGIDARRLGVYGVGMGAFAATLAAKDRASLRVLVLDSLYPAIEYPLSRRVYENWPFGVEHLSALPLVAFRLLDRTGASGERAADILPRLVGRDVLMVAPAGDVALAGEMERMYHTIPEQENADGNLITLPATLQSGLYGENLERYLTRVCAFFESRLVRSG